MLPWVTPRRKRVHKCSPPAYEIQILHGDVQTGDEWRCSTCGTCHVVTGRSGRYLHWRKINDERRR